MERWKSLIAIIGGSATVIGVVIGVLASMSRSSAADVVRPVEARLSKVETTISVSIPSMDHKLDMLIEAFAPRECRSQSEAPAIPRGIAPARAAGRAR